MSPWSSIYLEPCYTHYNDLNRQPHCTSPTLKQFFTFFDRSVLKLFYLLGFFLCGLCDLPTISILLTNLPTISNQLTDKICFSYMFYKHEVSRSRGGHTPQNPFRLVYPYFDNGKQVMTQFMTLFLYQPCRINCLKILFLLRRKTTMMLFWKLGQVLFPLP